MRPPDRPAGLPAEDHHLGRGGGRAELREAAVPEIPGVDLGIRVVITERLDERAGDPKRLRRGAAGARGDVEQTVHDWPFVVG
jgi:hypothetical protein